MDVQFFQPETLQEATRLLRHHGPDARPLAGGTDLVVHARQGAAPLPATIVYLGRIRDLGGIEAENGELRIGGGATHRDVELSSVIRESWTALCDASVIVGSPATRHVATIGGNLCNGSPAMEIGGPLLAFDATVRLVRPEGERTLPLSEFFLGPGRVARAQDEVLSFVTVPAVLGWVGSAYLRLEFRRAMEIAIVGATAVVSLDNVGAIADCRIALTAVAPTIIRVPEAEATLRGKQPSGDLFAQAGDLAARSSSPIDDVRSPAGYRRDMVKVLTIRALNKALERAQTK